MRNRFPAQIGRVRRAGGDPRNTPPLMAAMLVLCCMFAPAALAAKPYAVYGYEDELGMLHLSRSKRNANYVKLYTTRGPKPAIDHKALVKALRDNNAIRKGAVVSPAEIRKLVGKKAVWILRAAEPYLGAPYKFGGNTPAGIDCSGLTKAVFGRLGASLPRTSRTQAGTGVGVARESWLPGDLLFFSTDLFGKGVNHVGIYLGDGKMLHSSSRTGGVAVQPLAGSPYMRWYVTARRVYAAGPASRAKNKRP